MEYKVLTEIFVPEIEEVYEVYLPINKTIGEISALLAKMANNLSGAYPVKPINYLCNRRTGTLYESHQLLRDTDIRNGTGLVLF